MKNFAPSEEGHEEYIRVLKPGGILLIQTPLLSSDDKNMVILNLNILLLQFLAFMLLNLNIFLVAKHSLGTEIVIVWFVRRGIC